MFSLNRVQLIGYQTQPVAVRQTPQGTAVTDLNLVVPYQFQSQEGQTLSGKSFHVVTLWGPMAQVAGQFVRPGGQVYISGRLQTDTWEDEQSREKKSKTKVVAQEFIILDPKDGQHEAPAGAQSILGSLNRAEVIGNVTRDPEMRSTTGGHKVLTLGIASNERWKDKASGEQRERSEFHNVVLWGELAETVAAHVRKGAKMYLAGRVQNRQWETQSGSKRTTTEIVGDVATLLGVKSAVAQEVMQADATFTPQSARSLSAPAAQSDASSADNAVPPVPEIAYASEIRVEDLPF
jgi:single-strand DNA-binding protein